MSFCVRSIRIFSKFSCDPYYEPLSWFMILMTASICVVALVSHEQAFSMHNNYLTMNGLCADILPKSNVAN